MATKRKAIPPKLREEIFKKYDGHCAYCGKELTRKDFQVDHLIPVQREKWGKATEFEVENFNNFMPSCRRCNHYKRAHSLETFRRYIEEIPIMNLYGLSTIWPRTFLIISGKYQILYGAEHIG